ncbi:MAG: tetratricopeptide repeat protein [Myxococcota bacterium]
MQGKYDEAKPLHERAIAIGEKTLGAEHPELAKWLNNFAVLLQAQVCRCVVV